LLVPWLGLEVTLKAPALASAAPAGQRSSNNTSSRVGTAGRRNVHTRHLPEVALRGGQRYSEDLAVSLHDGEID
jgi:hypothetical protein